MLELSCEACQHDFNLKNALGCERPTQIAVWADEEDTFYSCPIKFIPDTISEWFTEYALYKDLGGFNLDHIPAKWIAAWGYYRVEYNSFCLQKQQEQKQHNDGLNRMKSIWHKK